MSLTCGCDSDGYAEIFRQSYPKARKEHKCADCGKMIQPGEEYEYTFQVFEGDASSCKSCLACAGIREALADLGFCFEMGELRSAYIEYLDEYASQAIRRNEETGECSYPRNHLTEGVVPTYDVKAKVPE